MKLDQVFPFRDIASLLCHTGGQSSGATELMRMGEGAAFFPTIVGGDQRLRELHVGSDEARPTIAALTTKLGVGNHTFDVATLPERFTLAPSEP